MKFTKTQERLIDKYMIIIENKYNKTKDKLLKELSKGIPENLPIKKKKELIIKKLKEMAYPILTKYEELFNNTKPKIENVEFSHSPNFEKNYIEIIIKFENIDNLKKILSELNKEIDKINKLLKIVKCEI